MVLSTTRVETVIGIADSLKRGYVKTAYRRGRRELSCGRRNGLFGDEETRIPDASHYRCPCKRYGRLWAVPAGYRISVLGEGQYDKWWWRDVS